MKNMKTRLTRLLVVFTLITVLLSATLIPSFAAPAGSDPILSGSEYGVSYDNGVYTISINAERLAEILSSRSFDKETLISVMPEAVYDLFVNRDAASVKALLSDLQDAASLGELKEDLPLDYFLDMFTPEELIDLVNIDKLLSILDIKAIIAAVPDDEIENLFIKEKLDALFESLNFDSIIDEDKIRFLLDDTANPEALTTKEITDALKPGAVERLVKEKKIDLKPFMEDDIILNKLFDESNEIITNSELEGMLKDKTIIQKILDDDEVLDEILYNDVFLQDLAAHPEVIDDLVTDQAIVEIFVKKDLLDDVIASATIPASKLKEIVFDNNIDVADFITPDVIKNLNPDVINSIISDSDIKKLSACLDNTEKSKIEDKIDISSINFSTIYPQYITESIIDAENIIDSADLDKLIALLSVEEKAEIIANNSYADIKEADFSILYPAYISAEEIKNSKVISADEYEVLATYIPYDDKIDIAIANDLISYSDVASYITVDDIKNNDIITDSELKSLNAQVFVDAGLTPKYVFDSFGADTSKAANIAINLYQDGKIVDGNGNVIGNKYINLNEVDFEDVVKSISDDERTIIVTEIKSVSKIKEHINDMIMADFSILAHALNYPKLYDDNIINDDMILDVIGEDVEKILNKNIISTTAIVDNVKDINSLTEEVTISALPTKKLLNAFDINELVDEVMKQNFDGLVKAINFQYLIKLDAVKAELKNITFSEYKSIFDFGAAKELLVAKTSQFIISDLKAVEINSTLIFVTQDGFDVANIEYAMLDAIPTFDKIAAMDSEGKAAEFIVHYMIKDKQYYNGFRIVFTGDTTAIKDYAAKMTEYASFVVGDDRSITAKIGAPAKIAELYISAIDGDKLPEELRAKLADIANVEFNKGDIGAFGDALIKKLTIAEIRDLLTAVDLKNIDDKLLEQLDLRESQVQLMLDYAVKAINKGTDILEGIPQLDAIYNKTIADFYTGNGTFEIDLDISVDLMEQIEKIKELPDEIKGFFDNTTIAHSISSAIELKGLYEVQYIKDGEVLYTAYRTEGYDLNKVTAHSTLAGLGANGWGGADAVAVETMPAEDIQLAEIFNATFVAYDSKGEIVSETVIPFTELSDVDTLVVAPEMPELDHYTFEWDEFEVVFEDFTVEGRYIPNEYTITFKADGQTVDTITYTYDDQTIDEPDVPAKEYYTGAWEEYELEFTADQVVNAVYTPNEYTITFKADGQTVDTVTYTYEDQTIDEPDVPEKEGYIGSWEVYELQFTTDQVVNAVYTLIDDETEYTATFWDGDTLLFWITYTEKTINDYNIQNLLPVSARGTVNQWSISSLPLANVDIYLIRYIIEYEITFVDLDGNTVATVPFNVFTTNFKAPEVPTVKGYNVAWEEFTLIDDSIYDKTGTYNQTVKAVATPITYNATFVDKDNKEIAKVPFTVENAEITAPEVPVLEGYTVKWPDFKDQILSEEIYEATGSYDFTVKAEYEAIKYTAKFVADGKVVAEIPFTVETKALEEPTVPAKAGYNGAWADYKLEAKDITIEAVYTAIEYKVTFKADGKEVAVRYYTVENKKIEEPAVPAKEGYKGEWEKYTLDMGDKVVNAVYTKLDPAEVTYYITFVDCDGNVIEKIPFTTSTDPSSIKAPATVPEKAGYNVYWPSFTLFDQKRFEETGTYSFTVTAVYEAIQYTATFVADGKVIAEIPFTVETESIEAPAIPEKAGYTAVWSSYVLGTEDITIDAIYSTISYKVTFMADGKEVAVLYYTVENKKIEEPAVPEKEGFTGEWEEYTLDMGDKVVNAVYTEIADGPSIFWWIMIGVLVVAAIVMVSVFFGMTKKKKEDAPAENN